MASVLASGALLAPPAQAAWTNGLAVQGAKVQVCKVPLGDGDLRVRVRLDNRGAQHAHIGSVYRVRGEQRTEARVRAASGKMSGTKALRVKRGDQVGVGFEEVTGEGLGGTMTRSSISRC
ncbi:hypothetical protein [Nocardioides sp. zg-DK7169]|uniref:hypothetical protein n=1 Tax=Nocardioides sp. zg-DK7169 TaxID=2736600 RepID=UPI00155212D8|nr:hypothetical protein [Nocardioides sp. zg-DK7169]NPC96648.1 hypothetical protein [Nocardioides sp. zg-DK7169]